MSEYIKDQEQAISKMNDGMSVSGAAALLGFQTDQKLTLMEVRG